jgi:hypothetical protein
MAKLVMRNIAVGIGEVLKEKYRICRTKLSERKPENITLEAGRKR